MRIGSIVITTESKQRDMCLRAMNMLVHYMMIYKKNHQYPDVVGTIECFIPVIDSFTVCGISEKSREIAKAAKDGFSIGDKYNWSDCSLAVENDKELEKVRRELLLAKTK